MAPVVACREMTMDWAVAGAIKHIALASRTETKTTNLFMSIIRLYVLGDPRLIIADLWIICVSIYLIMGVFVREAFLCLVGGFRCA